MAKRQTKRALITSVISLLVCFSMLVGTTFAWFTDSVTSSGNIIKSGTLDVTMHYADGKTDAPVKDSSDWKDATNAAIFKSDLWEPGYTEARHIKIENKGTLALKYQLKMIPSGIVGNLAEVIDVYYSTAGTAVADRDTTGMTKLGTLDKVISELDKTVSGELAAGENIVFTFVLKMQETAGNEYQNSSIGDSFSLQLLATQAVKESDSFGDDYDADAPFIPEWDGEADELPAEEDGVIIIKDAGELAALAAAVNGTSSASTYSLRSANQTFAGKTVKLGADINLAGSNWTPIGLHGDHAGFQGIFDGNGHTIYNLAVDLSGERAYQSAGLFGSINGATIKNLNIVNATVKNLDDAGNTSNGAAIVAGSSQDASVIDNVDVTGATVIGNRRVAAIAGYFQGTIKNCDVKDVTITATFDQLSDGSYDNADKVGGIVAYVNASGVIENNTVENATITGYRDIGGIAGHATSAIIKGNSVKEISIAIDKTYNYKNYTSDAAHDANSIVGEGTLGEGNTESDVESNKGDTDGLDQLLAALAAGKDVKLASDVDLADVAWAPIASYSGTLDGNGYAIKNLKGENGLFDNLSGATVKNLRIENVEITANSNHTGALAGYVTKSAGVQTVIDNVTVSGTVTGKDYYVGGIVGADSNYDTVIKNCVNNATVTASGQQVGGIVGYVTRGTLVENCVNNGAVTGGSFVGGIIGFAAGDDDMSELSITVKGCANNAEIAETNLGPAITWAGGVGGIIGNVGRAAGDNAVKLLNFYIINCTVLGGQKVYGQKHNVLGGHENLLNVSIYNEFKVSNSEELANAIANSSVADTNLFLLSEGIYGGDFKITVDALPQKCDFIFKAAEGENVVFSGTFTLGYREQTVGAAMWDANVTFEDVTFDHAEAAKHSLSVQDVKSLTLKNCKIIGDGEYGITSARGNGTGTSLIVGCTFENAGMQLLGNFATGLVIDDCTFNDSRINVQGGNGVTVKNCRFNAPLTDANVGNSFYLIRSNSTPITVENCKISIDSTVTGVASAQAKWGIFWNRGTTNWSVSDVEITMTDAAVAQTELLVTKTTSTGVINVTNVTVNGVEK